MVETVIVFPVFIFFFLGVVQMTMMHQARLMLEYAAFNAARAGAVWNADPNKMRHAALMSLIASRPKWPGIGGVGKIENMTELLEAFAILTGGEIVGNLVGGLGLDSGLIKLVKVDVLSPTQGDFAKGQEELDFDSSGDEFAKRRLGQLTIRVTYFYNLAVPFANWVIWNSWYQLRSSGMGQLMNINNTLHTFGMEGIDIGSKPFIAFDTTRFSMQGKILAEVLGGGLKSSPYECLTNLDWMTMLLLPDLVGDEYSYYIPLVTAHTIRMQSNHYKDNLPTADEARCGG